MYFLRLVIVLFQTCEEEHSNIKIQIINASTHTSLLCYLNFSALICKATGRVGWVSDLSVIPANSSRVFAQEELLLVG
jgi:hypothetical protein